MVLHNNMKTENIMREKINKKKALLAFADFLNTLDDYRGGSLTTEEFKSRLWSIRKDYEREERGEAVDKCKHIWKPMPDGVVDWVDNSDCWPLRWTVYHWYCKKCQKTKTTESGKNRS